MKTIFKKFADGDVIALFPSESNANGLIGSYQHVGQHSDASPCLIVELDDASLDEYTELEQELNGIGYEIEPYNTIEFHRPPTLCEIRLGHGATHYIDVPVSVAFKRDGTIKKRTQIDGIVYCR